jgi:hypothetical protein
MHAHAARDYEVVWASFKLNLIFDSINERPRYVLLLSLVEIRNWRNSSDGKYHCQPRWQSMYAWTWKTNVRQLQARRCMTEHASMSTVRVRTNEMLVGKKVHVMHKCMQHARDYELATRHSRTSIDSIRILNERPGEGFVTQLLRKMCQPGGLPSRMASVKAKLKCIQCTAPIANVKTCMKYMNKL